MSFETVLYEIADGVGTITLNRPDALNATNDTLYRELSGLIGDIAADRGVGAVVLTGAGRGFCAGADVKSMNPDAKLLDRRARHRWILRDILQPLIALEKPVIAAVNGPAVGAGFNIALACDIVIASEKAVFSQIFTRLALVPDLGGLYLLTRVVGLNKAKELCFTAKKVTAEEGHKLGFVNHVVPHEELMPRAQALAAEMAAGPPTSIAMIKTLLNKSSTSSLEQMLEYESFAQTIAYTTPEHKEGVAAFREKRQPNFRGAE
ncbi:MULTISPECIES: enoyl-CoA hydratase-related protein [unclassified Chelatococcus]|uniref:enoyl-CoA hydratase/isomerase family protein n=1 Tax=unclassified Chelatococcus TaxID=2638111 RepID=UPI001BCA8490|nr:enoyl-CoA hydratase-related protein [Chelatococcus sp.]MBS7742669.1 enoyl-CoA hydratase/isomerase family protein [Chelatococcus sp. HY11]MBX3542213.1 enoyl-CoA hydratase/isomerase family protein [Chelatococcus sp.]MCO5075570.1 enoyl-CoA hydratase-related protein [Chelatococcus sp.]